MAAICGGRSVHLIALVMRQRPVFALSGCICAVAASTMEAAEPITTIVRLFRILFSPFSNERSSYDYCRYHENRRAYSKILMAAQEFEASPPYRVSDIANY